jgi:prolyl oligopeptidase
MHNPKVDHVSAALERRTFEMGRRKKRPMRGSLLVFLGLLAAASACHPRAPSPPPPASSATAPTAALTPTPAPVRTQSVYPTSREDTTTEKIHGVTVSDPYRWLEDAANPEVKRWVSAQDAFARARLDALPLTEPLRKRFADLYYVDWKGAPFRLGRRYFWMEHKASQEKAVIYWRQGKSGEGKVLLDPNTWSTDGTIALGAWHISRNGRTLAYQVKKNAADEATLEFVDVGSGKHLEHDSIEGAKYSWSIGWSKNDDGVYYTWAPPIDSVPTAERPGYAEIRFHKLGTDPTKDPTIHRKTGDPSTFVYAGSDANDHYAYYVVQHGWVSREVYTLDLRDERAGWKPFIVGHEANYYVGFQYGRFYVRTDEGAPLGRVFSVDPQKTARQDWVQIVPEDPKRTLQEVSTIGGKLVLSYLDDAKTRLEVHDKNGKLERVVDLPGIGSAFMFGHSEDDEAYMWFSTFTQPSQIFKTSVTKGGLDLYAEVKVPFDPSPYVIEQVFATSKDKTKVPAFVVRRKDAKLDGSSPLLLYGYGGYGISITPAYWGSIVPWLERGGMAAFATLRGGGEYGENWHKAGMRRNKQNVFDDFHAVAKHLVAAGHTRPDRLAIRGWSNGGLLLGAAITQRPDLYKVALCGVPLLDMLRYHLVGAGKTWIEELGTPDDADDFKTLLAYSPYHHVTDGTKYPSVLLLSADTDDRVDPMHARKFAAMLQAHSTGGEILLRVQKNAGHGGADTIKSAVEESAHAFAFAMHEVGMDTPR